MFERQCQYSSLFGRDRCKVWVTTNGHHPPHVYLTSCMWLFFLGLSPPFLHTSSNQKLEVGTAWEQGYFSAFNYCVSRSAWVHKLLGHFILHITWYSGCRATYDVHNLTVMHMTFILCVTCTCSGLEVVPDVGCVLISPSGGRPGSESHSLGRRGQARQWSDTGLCSKVGGLSYQVAGNGRWDGEIQGEMTDVLYHHRWQHTSLVLWL